MDRFDRDSEEILSLRVILLVACVVMAVNCVGCMDCQGPSLPITRSWASGIYVANHSGAETLRVRLDSVWTRSYQYPDGMVFVDSGKWSLINWRFGGYQLRLDDFFHRSPEWIRHSKPDLSGIPDSMLADIVLPGMERLYDGSLLERGNMVPEIRNDFGRIRIWVYLWEVCSCWYDKVGSLPDSS